MLVKIELMRFGVSTKVLTTYMYVPYDQTLNGFYNLNS